MASNEQQNQPMPELIRASEVQPKEIDWLWYPFIPYGKVTLLQGDLGDGKSTFMLTIAALLTKGRPLPFAGQDEAASTLTRHVQALEKELGLTLIERTTREVRLSEEGEVFLPHAMNIVSEYDAALIAMQAFRDSREKKVRIGVVHNPDLYNIIEYLLEFQLEHPDIPIQIIEGSLSELQDEFLREKIRIYTMAYAD